MMKKFIEKMYVNEKNIILKCGYFLMLLGPLYFMLMVLKYVLWTILLINFGIEYLDKLNFIFYFNLLLFAGFSLLIFIWGRKHKLFWFTLLLMLVCLTSGILTINIVGNHEYFLTNIGVLLSVVLFSLPVAMAHLKQLYYKDDNK